MDPNDHDLELMQRMRLRSLELGVVGPSADDLAAAPKLSQWLFIRTADNLGVALAGEVTGHPSDVGPLINTSALCGLGKNLKWARSVSRWYRLEGMSSVQAMYEKWGSRVDGLAAAALELEAAQVRVARDQALEGYRDDV